MTQSDTDAQRTSWRGPDSFHFTEWQAYRARRKWMREVRGRDSYVYRLPGLYLRRWKVTRIDYAPPETKA